MSTRFEAWLWIAQRASAAVLALAVLVHLITIIYAVHVGLTAAAILGRLHGNLAWFAFYLVFATAAGIHAGIGVRTIVREHAGWHGGGLDFAMVILGMVLAVAGWGAAGVLFA